MVDSGHVQEVILENFKSYEGRVRVGPFQRFTCVVGQNGAGKSNLLDAIAFVLCVGVAARRRRGGNAAPGGEERLRDLVHQKDGEDIASALQRTVSVELLYVRRRDFEGSAPEVLSFKRILVPDGSAQIQVDGQEVTQQEYLALLKDIHILSEARNFFVFQGDVEAAAKRQGKELARFFEQISGSGALREKYEQLAAEKTQREEEVRLLYHRKRSVANEKKTMTHQKAEAERYQRLEAERHRLHLEYYLFRFQGLALRVDESERAITAAEFELAPLAARLEEKATRLKAAEKARAAAHLATQKADKEATAMRKRIEQQQAELVSTKGQLVSLSKQLEDRRLRDEEQVRRAGELETEETSLADLQKKTEQELQEQEQIASREMPFTPDQRAEFDRVQQEANRLTASSNAQMRELEAQLRANAIERSRAEREMQGLVARVGHLTRKVAELEEAERNQRGTLARNTSALQARTTQLEKLQDSMKERAREREEKMAERQLKFQGIQDIAATERQIEHEQEMARVSADLMRLFPGVRGRILDLCRPANDTYSVAFNVALDGSFDAIVTDTADVARQCVQYLKEHMLRPITFMPLDNLRVPPVDAQLQDAVRSNPAVRLALHCVSFDESVGRAFHFLLGDVVFATTLQDGRQFAFEDLRARGLSCRVVTQDGVTISRDGNLSVNSEKTQKGATRLLLSSLEKDRELLAQLDRRLHELHRLETTGGAEQAALQEEVRRLELATQEGDQSLRRTLEDLDIRRTELQDAETARRQLEPQISGLSDEEARIGEELRVLEETISETVAVHFRDLSQAMGVADIRRKERQWRQEKEAAKLRCRDLSLQLGGIKAELAMVRQTLEERAARRLSGTVAECEEDIERHKGREAELVAALEACGAEFKELEESAQDLLDKENAAERVVASCRSEAREEQQRVAAVDKRMSELATDIQEAQEMKSDLLKRSVLEGIEVPVAPGKAPLDVDLSQLPEEKRAAASGPAAQLLEDEYRSLLQQAAAELERAMPNFKAAEELERVGGLRDQAYDINDEHKAAHKAVEEVKQAFEAVRQERRELFMTCFQQVSAEISTVYSQLSRRATGFRDGGSAFLDLEDVEDPWNGGVRFTAMPPTKRFCDMSLLSGGERALAALALLFAVQAFQKPPFLILDEVDAHLDSGGVRALAAYVSGCACQTLVVSLRDALFTKSEALVGVSKDEERQSSVVFTVDLRQFRRPVASPATSPAPLPPLAAGSPARGSPSGAMADASPGQRSQHESALVGVAPPSSKSPGASAALFGGRSPAGAAGIAAASPLGGSTTGAGAPRMTSVSTGGSAPAAVASVARRPPLGGGAPTAPAPASRRSAATGPTEDVAAHGEDVEMRPAS